MKEREIEQPVLIGVFRAVYWDAAKFSDMQLRQVELFLCLPPSAGSVAAGMSLEGRDTLSYGKAKVFHVDPASKSISLL